MSFGDTQVLHDVSFKFERGKTNLVIGQSGSGKSVLTKCIIGLHAPENGQILYDGVDFSAMKKKEKKKIRTQIGMLFQGGSAIRFLKRYRKCHFSFKNVYQNEQKRNAG